MAQACLVSEEPNPDKAPKLRTGRVILTRFPPTWVLPHVEMALEQLAPEMSEGEDLDVEGPLAGVPKSVPGGWGSSL